MGRTLHFTVKKDNGRDFTDKEIQCMYEISMYYNSGRYEDIWTCENFFLTGLDYYPYWKDMGGKVESWEEVHSRVEALEAKGLKYVEVIKTLYKEGLIRLFNNKGLKVNSAKGFTKVQGNEYNSLLVYKALIDVSKAIKGATIYLRDEGKFLLCSLVIKNGKVLPDMSSILDNIRYYTSMIALNTASVLKELDLNDLSSEFKKDLNIRERKDEEGYDTSNYVEYINEYLRDLKLVQNSLYEFGLKGHELFFYNIENRDPKDWFPPEYFCRIVNPKDFEEYKMAPGTLMDGFHGEAFGLSDEDSESKSYKMIALIRNLFKGIDSNKELKVLGE